MAAMAGCDVDNAIVEIDANEPPIDDGSAREYGKMIDSAGVTAQPEMREPYRVTEPIQIRVGDASMAIFPDDKLRITCTSADDQGLFTQYYSTEITPDTWHRSEEHTSE